MIETYVLADPLYPIELQPILDWINKLQNRVRIGFVNKSLQLAKDRFGGISAGETFPRIASQPFYDPHRNYIIFTHQRLEENYFAKSQSNLTIISSFDWEYLTDVPLEYGAAFSVCSKFYQIIRKEHKLHYATRGCPFDFAEMKTDIDLGLKIGKLCSECQRIFDNDPQVDRKDTHAVSLLLDHIVDCWRAGKSLAVLDDAHKQQEKTDKTKGPFIPTGESPFFKVDLESVEQIEQGFLTLEASKDSGDNKKKGQALEKFVKSLFDRLEGFTFCGQDLRLQDCEVDLSYRVDAQLSDLHRMLEPIVLIECKNRKTPATVQDISHHIVRLSHRKLKAGIFVSVGGITGYSPAVSKLRDSLSLIVDEYRQNGRFILPMVWEDILAVRRGMDLPTLLNNKINEIILQ